MAPGSERILAEPPPEGGPADLRDEPLGHHFPPQLGQRPARQRNAPARRQLTREGFDLDDDAGGKSGLCARLEALPQGRAVARRRNGAAICSQSGAAYRVGRR